MSNEPGPGSTSQIAGQQAARKAGGWRLRILDRLREVPSTLWELANHFGVPDHAISGRVTELARDQYIERTGERRNKPESGCPADVWRINSRAGIGPPAGASELPVDLVREMGYPDTLVFDGDLYDRQALLPSESDAGMPYARRADTGGVRLLVRVQLIECPRCGMPLFQDSSQPRRYWCGNGRCRTWTSRFVKEPGRGAMPALVMER